MTDQTEHPLRRKESYQTDDVELLSARYYAAPIDYIQVDSGGLGAKINTVATRNVEVREAHFQSSVMNIVERPVGRFGLAMGLSGNAQLFGNRFNDSNVVYSDGRNGIIARIAGGSGWCNLTIDETLLQQVAAVHGYSIPAGDAARGLPTAERTALCMKVVRIARSREGATLSNEQFEDAIALLVLRSINRAPAERKIRLEKCWTLSREIIDFIHANYASPMTLTALCQLVDVGERALRYNFQKATGMSLQQYLTHYRLHRARALLVESQVAEVKEAAVACGIPHAGRFSQYFKALFDESPSELLRRPASVYRGRRNL